NIFPIESIYFWTPPTRHLPASPAPGKIVKDKELAMIIKTKKGNFQKIEEFILKNRKYKL
ncbi:MAG: divalent cation tolerance protein CutA, partial [bacterium]